MHEFELDLYPEEYGYQDGVSVRVSWEDIEQALKDAGIQILPSETIRSIKADTHWVQFTLKEKIST